MGLPQHDFLLDGCRDHLVALGGRDQGLDESVIGSGLGQGAGVIERGSGPGAGRVGQDLRFERLGRDGRVVSALAEDLAKELTLP